MAETANFDDAPIGSAPKGWTITMTGKGDPQWTVEKDDTAPSQANVLKQSGKATYPLALKDGTSIKNGFIAVKFKAISGSEDRAAGLVWRAVDANNYYVVRANALEDNVVQVCGLTFCPLSHPRIQLAGRASRLTREC